MAGWVLDEWGRRVWLREGDVQAMEERERAECRSLSLERTGMHAAAYRSLLLGRPEAPEPRPMTATETVLWMNDWMRSERCWRYAPSPKKRGRRR